MVFTEFCLQRCKFYFKTPQTNYLFFISYSYITDHMGTPCEVANVYGLTVSLPCESLRINHGDM